MFKQVLYGIRVLDLAPGWSAYGGRLLGDLGAEVIKIEAPTGDPLRGKLDFQRLNANKYGCTLDLSTKDGRGRLAALAAVSDVVVAPAGAVDFKSLGAANQSLITVELPADAGATQAVAAAAAVGVALWDRRRTGLGSHVVIPAATGEPLPKAKGAAVRECVSTPAGEVEVESTPWRLSESPTHVRLPAPALGEHDEYVRGLVSG